MYTASERAYYAIGRHNHCVLQYLPVCVSHLNQVNGLFAAGFFFFSGLLLRALDVALLSLGVDFYATNNW
jgi:hypothetical protein